MPGDDFRRVKEAVPIQEVIGSIMPLIAKGKGYACLCPFHDDHNPSMSIVPDKGIFHCFVCGASGDAINFISKYHGVSAGEALGIIANGAGIKLSGPIADRKHPALQDALENACRFFQESFPGSPAEEYLRGKRGITEETIGKFRIGYAPDSWDVHPRILETGLEAAMQIGLVRRSERGRDWSFFRNRLMFPITDTAGRVTAFAARTLDPDEKIKYLNSPEGPTYAKSQTLFGIQQASKAIRVAHKLHVVEGYVDVLATHQVGVCNTVATGGTALTDDHVRILEKKFPNHEIVLAFDGDEAGIRAASRASGKVLGHLNATVCLLPEDEDPAGIIETGGDIRRVFNDYSVPLSTFYIEQRSKGKDLSTPEGVAAFLGEITTDVQNIPPKAQALYITKIAEKTGINPDVISAQVLDLEWRLRTSDQRAYWESTLIHNLVSVASGEVVAHVTGYIKPDNFSVPEARAVYEWFTANKPEVGGLFGGGDAPLFKPGQLDNLTDEIMATYERQGIPLNRKSVSYLLRPKSNGRRIPVSEIERSATMVRTNALLANVNRVASNGANIADLTPALESLEQIVRGYDEPGHIN